MSQQGGPCPSASPAGRALPVSCYRDVNGQLSHTPLPCFTPHTDLSCFFPHQAEVHCLNTVCKITSQVNTCLQNMKRFKTYHGVWLLGRALVQDSVSCQYLSEVLPEVLLINPSLKHTSFGMQSKTWVNQHYSHLFKSDWKLNSRELPTNITRTPVRDGKV